jgi:hypothetical protein
MLTNLKASSERVRTVMTTTGRMDKEFENWKNQIAAKADRILFAARRGGYFFALAVNPERRLKTHYVVLEEATSGYLERILIRPKGERSKTSTPMAWGLGSYASGGRCVAEPGPPGSDLLGAAIKGRFEIEATLRGNRRSRFKGEFTL